MKASILFVAGASACADYHYVYARGTGDLSGFGTVGTEVNANLQAVLGSAYTSYAIPYPAGFDIGPSSSTGIQLTAEYINYYTSQCPNAQLFVGGYSQGAIVVHGAIRTLTNETKAHILGLSTFGDPFRNVTEGLNYLSFCNEGDPICVNGNNFNAHLAYIGDGSALKSAQFFEGLTPIGNKSEVAQTQASFTFPPQALSTTITTFPVPTGGSSPSNGGGKPTVVSSSGAASSGKASSSKGANSASSVARSSSKLLPTARTSSGSGGASSAGGSGGGVTRSTVVRSSSKLLPTARTSGGVSSGAGGASGASGSTLTTKRPVSRSSSAGGSASASS